jgi:hypothetical protein
MLSLLFVIDSLSMKVHDLYGPFLLNLLVDCDRIVV